MDQIAALEADNRRLRQLLEQRNAPSELRHRLRSTVSAIRSIIRKSADNRTDFDEYIAHVEDRLDTLVRVQTMLDQYGSAELHTLIADELFRYTASEGEQLHLSGPDVRLEPRMAQPVAMALHELAVNAVEHGTLSERGGSIQIVWDVISGPDEDTLHLSWKESGPGVARGRERPGFGTDVLINRLAYDLKATAKLDMTETGLRYDVSFPLRLKAATALSA